MEKSYYIADFWVDFLRKLIVGTDFCHLKFRKNKIIADGAKKSVIYTSKKQAF